mmetsp:Transcript_28783/g.73343  ORF Transcript_28783/g.73343 Transcript_28783/m.73343 type:complete len:234 (+) Transcript_28783:392-1093(+)
MSAQLARPSVRLAVHALQHAHGHRLGALDGQAQRARPHALRQHTQRARHAEQHGVEVGLADAVVLQQHARVRVHVGPRVLDLAGAQQHRGHHLVQRRHQLEQRVLGQVLERKLALARVARVRLAQHRVPVPGHHLAVRQRVRHVRLERLAAGRLAQLGHQRLQPHQHLLVGQAVQRARQPVEARREGEVGVRQRGAHQVRGVRRHVAALVVRVDGLVQAGQLVRALAVVPHHV